MASQALVTTFNKMAKELKSIDKIKLLRPNLGDVSLETKLSPKLQQVYEGLEFALEFGPKVLDKHLNPIISVYQGILTSFKKQLQHEQSEYVAHSKRFLEGVDRNLEEFKELRWTLVIEAVLAKGLLKDKDIEREHKHIMADIKKEANKALQELKQGSAEMLAKVEIKGQEIVGRARKTARGTSVEEAQKQFKEAQEDCIKQTKLWANLSVASLVLFLLAVIYLFLVATPVVDKWYELTYYAAVRVITLSILGVVMSFCFSMLRAYLHMKQHNIHRQRLANSMPVLMDSASTDQQRDLILSQLVDAIASFGSSGLISKKSDAAHTPRVSIDAISRSFTSPTD